jgi:hypothetical protein
LIFSKAAFWVYGAVRGVVCLRPAGARKVMFSPFWARFRFVAGAFLCPPGESGIRGIMGGFFENLSKTSRVLDKVIL